MPKTQKYTIVSLKKGTKATNCVTHVHLDYHQNLKLQMTLSVQIVRQ